MGGQGKKIILWKQIAAEMYKKGINVDGKICDEKFRRMKTNYTKLHDQSKQTGRGPVKWKWFKDMENIVHTKDTASPPKGSISCIFMFVIFSSFYKFISFICRHDL